MIERCLVVVPAYNEADTIAEVVRRASAHADVCVIDDGSSDGTSDIVAAIDGAHCIRHEQNTHIAGAMLDGFRYAEERDYPYCITMDAGLSHDPDAIPTFLAVDDADLVMSYRAHPVGVPLRRRALSWTATRLMNVAIARRAVQGTAGPLRDVSSGYRMYSRAAYGLVLHSNFQARSFDFHLEAVARIARAGLSIAEVPISYRYTNSSLRLRVLADAVRTYARIWTDDLP